MRTGMSQGQDLSIVLSLSRTANVLKLFRNFEPPRVYKQVFQDVKWIVSRVGSVILKELNNYLEERV